MFRPLLCLTFLTCMAAAAACGSGSDAPRPVAGSPRGAPAGSPAGPCPSAAEVIAALDAKGWTGFKVTGRIVCDGGWATTVVEMAKEASDPARAVLRQENGRWRGVTYGTDGLCQAPGMSTAPAAIKTALNPYC